MFIRVLVKKMQNCPNSRCLRVNQVCQVTLVCPGLPCSNLVCPTQFALVCPAGLVNQRILKFQVICLQILNVICLDPERWVGQVGWQVGRSGMVWFGLEGSEFRTVTISATQVLKYQAAKKNDGWYLMFRLIPSSLMVRVLLKYPFFLPVYDLFKSLFFLPGFCQVNMASYLTLCPSRLPHNKDPCLPIVRPRSSSAQRYLLKICFA